MKTIFGTLKTTKQKVVRAFKMNKGEYRHMDYEYLGLCLNCGSEAYECEPDAREYTCQDCDKDKVYGMQELMLMGKIILTNESEDKNE